jgi:hypothetical protein
MPRRGALASILNQRMSLSSNGLSGTGHLRVRFCNKAFFLLEFVPERVTILWHFFLPRTGS